MMSSNARSWSDLRDAVLERDDYQCRFCGDDDDSHREKHGAGLDVHHIIPESDGGEDSMDNLAALCRSCHRTLESLHAQAMATLKQKEDHKEDLAAVNSIFEKHFGNVRSTEDALADFIEGHPVFRNHHGLYNESDEEKPSIYSWSWEDKLPSPDEPIVTEWGFAISWGYKEGMMDVVSELDGRTGVPFDLEEDDE